MRPSLGTLAVVVLFAQSAQAAPPPDFDRDVRPILEQHCFKCHGPEKQKGGLRLDVKPAALKGGDSGEPAIVPGNSLKSHLIQLVSSNDPEQAMPPKGERLKPEEIARLQKWIETGAHWQDKAAVATSQPIIAVAADAKISAADRQIWSVVPPR